MYRMSLQSCIFIKDNSSLLFFLNFYLFSCAWVFCMLVHNVPCTHVGQKRAPDPLGPVLDSLRHHVGTGNQKPGPLKNQLVLLAARPFF